MGFDMDNYPMYDSVNTQAAEQGNSRMRRIARQLSFMQLRNGAEYVRFYVCCLNYKKRIDMLQNPDKYREKDQLVAKVKARAAARIAGSE
jgi:hypothetical protein